LPRLLPGSRDRRWWVGFTCLAEALALALTYVRGAWLGVGCGVLALAAMARRARRILLGVLLVAVMVLVVAAPGLRQRATSIVDPADPTGRERLLIWKSGLRMARDHPILGVGPGRVGDLYRRYADFLVYKTNRGHVHNTPLQVLVERGPFGLLAWLWLFAAFYLEGRRALSRLTAPQQERERALVIGSMAASATLLC